MPLDEPEEDLGAVGVRAKKEGMARWINVVMRGAPDCAGVCTPVSGG